jgi:Fe-S cluster assembly ATP-binding protein
MAVLDPKLSVLDETDSGLILTCCAWWPKGSTNFTIRIKQDRRDALPAFAQLHRLISCTCFRRRIVKEGGKELALELEERGYDWLERNGKAQACRRRVNHGNGSS